MISAWELLEARYGDLAKLPEIESSTDKVTKELEDLIRKVNAARRQSGKKAVDTRAVAGSWKQLVSMLMEGGPISRVTQQALAAQKIDPNGRLDDDIEQMADAIYAALEMAPGEVRGRMAGMRRHVKAANVYRWAANLLSELAEIEPERAQIIASA